MSLRLWHRSCYGVPTGDQRDWMFADKYGLDKIVVVTPKDQELKLKI
ncbi:MAG: hypothetical protein ACLR2G_04590 [Phascolarctobacterium faecium]